MAERTDLILFYKSRSKEKDKHLYDYDQDGNLIEKDKEGRVLRTIVALPEYRKPSYEEIKEMEEKRANEILRASEAVEELREELYTAYDQEMKNHYLQTDAIQRLLILNRKVQEAEDLLGKYRSPIQTIESIEGVEIRQIMFDKPHDSRKIPYPVRVLSSYPFELQDLYTRIGNKGKAAFTTVSEERQKEAKKKSRPVRSSRSSSSSDAIDTEIASSSAAAASSSAATASSSTAAASSTKPKRPTRVVRSSLPSAETESSIPPPPPYNLPPYTP